MFCESEMEDVFVFFQNFSLSWLANKKIKLLSAVINLTTFSSFFVKNLANQGHWCPLRRPQSAGHSTKPKWGAIWRDPCFLSWCSNMFEGTLSPFRDIHRSQGETATMRAILSPVRAQTKIGVGLFVGTYLLVSLFPRRKKSVTKRCMSLC